MCMENTNIRPKHYRNGIETIEKMRKIWGDEAVAIFCEINAFKYRERMFLKGDPEEDFQKEQWYLRKAEELRNNINPDIMSDKLS